MARAAHAALGKDKNISLDRVLGVLGLLQRSPLATRIGGILDIVSPTLSAATKRMLTTRIRDARNNASHGGSQLHDSWIEAIDLRQVLLGACISMDLLESGVPLTFARGEILPLRRLYYAAGNLQRRHKVQ
jgi:hypothetical protein